MPPAAPAPQSATLSPARAPSGHNGARRAHTGFLYSKRCACCNALYNMSYASGGTKLPAGKQLVWADLTSDKDGEDTCWVQCSRDTIWAASLLRRFTAQSLHSHSGALSFFL